MSIQTEIILLLIASTVLFFWLWRKTTQKLFDVRFQKQSLSSKYGKITEQFLPFLDSYPYNPSNFRFIGTPIDGIQFEDDRIVFLEFKAGDSRLTSKQSNIKRLLSEKEIYFEEVRLR